MDKKKKKMKCYEVGLDSEVYAVSLVSDPAIESNFIYLSKEKPLQVCLEKEDKHLVIGAVLIPDKPIYRNQDNEEFYIQFSRETIEKLAHNFISNGYVWNFTKDHDEATEGKVQVVESWVKSSESDKSNDLGLNVPVGTWLMAAHINDEELWQSIKQGERKGFSIEAICNLDEINKLIENNKMTEIKQEAVEITDGFWDKLKSIIADALGKGEESKEVEDTVGEIADAIEDGAGPKDEETKVVEQEEAVEPVEEVKPEEIAEEVVAVVEEVSETPAEEAENLQAVIDELNAKIAEKDAEIEELKKQNQKLSKQPSTKPTVKMAENKQNPYDVIQSLYKGTYFNK